MLQRAADTEREILSLLLRWGGAFLRLQIDLPGEPALHGGLLCPACRMIHGRSHEAAYPLLTLAARTGEERFLLAARKLLLWGDTMQAPDGSLRNDAKSDWRGVTVFGALALHDALFYHGSLLPASERARQAQKLAAEGQWLCENLRPGKTQAYLNYYAANAAAMALLGRYFGKSEWLALSRELADFCFSHVTEGGLVFGEGHPLALKTEKGCRAVDPGGYNPEETLPSLTRYAAAAGDETALLRCRELWRAQLLWMLPDGAWDGSVGSRAFKWTYWGSRTADGCQEALFLLGRTEPAFAEAALRNLALYGACTEGGLLYGGPHYARRGERPCLHHSFCHAKTLAGSLNGGLYDFERALLPADRPAPVSYYPELDTFRLAAGPWRATVAGSDQQAFPGAHASGGALSLLWHEKAGPVIAAGAPEFRLREPMNQQLPEQPERCRPLCPRFEIRQGAAVYAQHFDPRAKLSAAARDGAVFASAQARFCTAAGEPMPGENACRLDYELRADSVTVRGFAAPGGARFVLPLIGPARPAVQLGSLPEEPLPIFNLNPGFEALEYTVYPDETGRFALTLSI